MPQVTFTDSPSPTFELVPNGDYAVEIVKVESALSQGGKTSGCPKFDYQVRLDGHPNCSIWEDMTFEYEKLQWKIDVFVKCFNFTVNAQGKYDPNGRIPAKGQPLSIEEEDLLGLRGWVTVGQREYEKDGEKKKTNEIKVWLTNKPKLPRNMPVDDPTEPDPWEV